MYVIGTAGHVDHGKSTLVKALTGIDPDRLAEEKRREMTIDLGFAWLVLPSGREVSIVDVPGHERFVKNMLAGVGGVDLALLVVAADESVMPQTREHVAILDLLQVNRAIVALTKCDLADPEMRGLVTLEIEELLRGTALAGAPVVPVSSFTGEGLPALVRAIDGALASTETRRDLGRPRLPVDRSFPISGFGTVVTGTLVDGTLRVGQDVELVRAGLRARVRGLQTHRVEVDVAQPGSRVAANLSGVAHTQAQRGDVVTVPGWLRLVQAVDVRLRVLPSVPHALRHNTPATFHAYTVETEAKVRLLESNELAAGEQGWAQMVFEEPVPLVRGDRFVLRSPNETLGGGVVVDVDPPRHRRRHAPTLARLSRLSGGSAAALLLTALEGDEPAGAGSVARLANVSLSDALVSLRDAVADGTVVALGAPLTADTLLYSGAGWMRLQGRAKETLAAFHAESPLRAGMSREELRSRLGLSAAVAQLVVQRLAEDGSFAADGDTVRLPEHRVAVAPAQQREMDAYVAALARDPFAATPPAIAPVLLALLVERGRVIRAGQDVVFDTETCARLEGAVKARLRANGKVTVAEVRDMLKTSRRFALALLEHLDEQHVTRRVGDERIMLQG